MCLWVFVLCTGRLRSRPRAAYPEAWWAVVGLVKGVDFRAGFPRRLEVLLSFTVVAVVLD